MASTLIFLVARATASTFHRVLPIAFSFFVVHAALLAAFSLLW